ncbi:hypothetical protein PS15p_209987 [Mucor circinelloides]
MISLSVIGGPGKPTNDIMSFLKPILNEIHLLNQNGLCVKKNDRVVYTTTGFVHLFGCTGDIPGIAELMGHYDGHASFFGCRMRQVQGIHPEDPIMNGMYFPGTGADRTIEELINGDPDRNLNAVDPLFCHLDTFTGVEFFLDDEMHLLGQGLSKRVFNMLNPRTAA